MVLTDNPDVYGYQIVNVGGNKVGGSATNLVTTPATFGYKIVSMGAGVTAATASGLAADVPATYGYQTVNVGGTRVGGSATGLANNATVYTASVSCDAGGDPHVRPISIVGSAAQTYADLITELSADDGGWFVATLDSGNIKIVSTGGTSGLPGATTSIAITDTNLFSTLTTRAYTC